MQVGIPGLNWARRTIRAPVNPLDKSTVISIYPREINEVKPTMQPGRFIIPAGSYNYPSLLTIGTSSWWREIDENQPMLEIPVSSIQIAESIVRDFANGLLACNMDTAMPGLFFIPGVITVDKIPKEQLDEARKKQNNWFMALVKMADVLWSRSNGNPLAIDDNMRSAARELGLNKEWLKDFTAVELTKCVACGSLRNPMYPVCPICKAVVDPDAAKKLNLSFAS